MLCLDSYTFIDVDAETAALLASLKDMIRTQARDLEVAQERISQLEHEVTIVAAVVCVQNCLGMSDADEKRSLRHRSLDRLLHRPEMILSKLVNSLNAWMLWRLSLRASG